MLLYPLYEWWFNLLIELNSAILIPAVIILIVIGLFLGKEIAGALVGIIFSPALAYIVCYVCKAVEDVPILGLFGIIIRIISDISVLGTLVILILFAIASRMAKW